MSEPKLPKASGSSGICQGSHVGIASSLLEEYGKRRQEDRQNKLQDVVECDAHLSGCKRSLSPRTARVRREAVPGEGRLDDESGWQSVLLSFGTRNPRDLPRGEAPAARPVRLQSGGLWKLWQTFWPSTAVCQALGSVRSGRGKYIRLQDTPNQHGTPMLSQLICRLYGV